MSAAPIGLLVHGAVALALITAYVVVTLSGHDADPLLGVLAGYVAGAGTQVGLREAGKAPPP